MKRYLSPVLVSFFISLIFFCGSVSQINAASVWTQQTSSVIVNWFDFSSSSDGTKLAAVAFNTDYIYTSINSGITWTTQTSAGLHQWSSITSSSDGTKLAATTFNGYIYTSSDSGVTWTEQTNSGARLWTDIASSSDGTKLAATVAEGSNYVYTSNDSGISWLMQTSVGQYRWGGIASSADGIKLVAIVGGNGFAGYIHTSIDSGLTWTQQLSSGTRQWSSITSSSDGTKLAATTSNGYIYTSTDSGATWTEQTFASQRQWTGIASSSDGIKLAAVYYNNSYIYTSTDSGATWTEQTSAGYRLWYGIASSSDGTKLVAGLLGGNIYTYGPQTSPTLSTRGATLITSSTNTLNGEIIGTGGDSPTVRGFEYGLSTSYGQTTTESGSFSTGSFSANLTFLTPSTTYHFRSYATNSFGINYGEDRTFTTLPLSAPLINTYADSNTTFTTATLNGSITMDGGSSITVRGFQYGIDTGYGQTTTESGSFSTGSFSANLTSLTPNTTYHFRSYATNSFGTSYGEDRIFVSIVSYWQEQTSSGQHLWFGITSSSDGTKLAAVDYNYGYIYTSNNSGATWTAQTYAGQQHWYGITSSSDGTKLAAVSYYNGLIYTSTDSGITWSARNAAGYRYWYAIASSSDGTNLAAVNYGGYIYTSTDSGITWTTQTSSGQHNWRSIASSSDGSKLAAGDYGGYIYTSSDFGITWLAQSSAGQRNWYSIASSADGTKLAAVDNNNGYIYTSVNSGITWTTQTSAGQHIWRSIASSSDGSKLAAVDYGGYIYTSFDNGITWTTQTSAGQRYWGSIASSANGNKLAAVDTSNAFIYTYGPQTGPILSALSATLVTPSTAILNGQIDSTGGENPTIRGFEYGLSESYGTKTTDSGSFSTGLFASSLLTKLTCDTLYYFRLYSTNIVGTSYSSDMTFTTSTCPTISSVSTTEATSVTPTKVKLNGEITDDGGEVATRGFNYGLTTSYGTDTEESASYHNGLFSTNLTSLSCNTTYHYRGYSTNFAGTSYGDDLTFATSACSTIPEISSLIPDSKTSITVNVSGSTNNYYIENSTKENGSGWTTNNSYQFKNLTCNSEYSFRVKGKGSDGIETVWSSDSNVFLPCIIIEATSGFGIINTQQDFENGDLEASLDVSSLSGDLSLKSKPSGIKYSSQWGEWGSLGGQFSNPSGIDTDREGNVYVSDTYNNRIQKFSSDRILLMAIGYGVTDGSNLLQVCTVNCLAGLGGQGDGQLSSPWGIDVDEDDNIYVVDSSNNRIQKFNPDGSYNSKFGTVGSGDGQFSNPTGITIDANGSIYVVDNGNKRIQKFDSDGAFNTKWGDTTTGETYGLTFDKNLSIPSSWVWSQEAEMPTTIMAAGSAVIDDKIYIAGGTDSNGDPFDSLFVYDPSTGENGEWTTKDSMPYGTTSAVSAVVDDKLYVIGGKDMNWMGIKTMEVYDGTIGVEAWTTKYNGTEEDLAPMSKARIGAVGGYYDGKIYVVGGAKESCAYNSEVSMEVYDISTNTWLTKSSAPINKLTGGTAQFIDGIMYVSGGQFYCDNEFSNSLVSYNPATDSWNTQLATMPVKLTGGASAVVDGKFYYIGGTGGIDWNTQGDIFVYDPIANTWQTYGGALQQPLHRSMVSLVGNDLYVTGGKDYNGDSIATNYKINKSDFAVLSESAKIITSITWTENLPTEDSVLELFYTIDSGVTWKLLGATPGTYNIPAGVINSLHFKVVYTSPSPDYFFIPSLTMGYTMDEISSEYQDNEVSGNYFRPYNVSTGNELIDPIGIESDSAGSIYVTDSNNGRSGFVYKFDSEGTLITKWGFNSPEYLVTYFSPSGIAIDSVGNTHFLETATNVVYKTKPDGTLLFHYGDDGSGDGEIDSALDIAIDSSDSIYIADTGNNRIQKFEIAQGGSQSSGTFISSVINATANVDWTTLVKDETLPEGASIIYSTHSGATSIPDGTWSLWQETTGDILSPNNQYLQVKAILSSDGKETPVLHSLTLNYVGKIELENESPKRSHISTGTTSAAIIKFQTEQQKLREQVQTTVATPTSTVNFKPLSISRTLKLKVTGDDVRALQVYLNLKNYNCGIADGSFGKKTKAAVILFQKANNLVADGIVGSKTREVMN